MSAKSFGLDIGVTSLKAVELTKKKNGFILNSAITIASPSKGVLSEAILDQEEVAMAIRRIVNEGKITSKVVHLALPENQVYTRIIEMPVLSDKELSTAIYWEAEQYIPVPLETLQLAWEILKKPDHLHEDAKMQVLLVGAPLSLLSRYEKILGMTGLTIGSVETEILSAIRSLVAGDHYPNTLIVSIGAMSTSLAIIKDHIIVFTYSIPTGGNAINRAIATDFGFSMDEAEQYKKLYGMSEEVLGGKIGQATTPILMSIIDEVKKAIAYYTEKYKQEAPISQIVLSGGSAKLPGIQSFFADHSGVEIAMANPWKILVSQQVPKEILDNAPHYSVAVGLAMKDYE